MFKKFCSDFYCKWVIRRIKWAMDLLKIRALLVFHLLKTYLRFTKVTQALPNTYLGKGLLYYNPFLSAKGMV